MNEVIDDIALHWHGLTAVSTLFIAGGTTVSAILTRALIRENRLLRKADAEPRVVAYLANHPHHWDLIRFVISNVGRGAARNVSFRFLTREADFESHGVSVSNTPDRRPLGFLPQGETYAVFFGAVDRLLAKPRLRPFQVAVSYQDLDGRPRSEKFLLDVGQFEGFRSLGAPPEREMADSLKQIAGHLRQVPPGGQGPAAGPAEDRS